MFYLTGWVSHGYGIGANVRECDPSCSEYGGGGRGPRAGAVIGACEGLARPASEACEKAGWRHGGRNPLVRWVGVWRSARASSLARGNARAGPARADSSSRVGTGGRRRAEGMQPGARRPVGPEWNHGASNVALAHGAARAVARVGAHEGGLRCEIMIRENSRCRAGEGLVLCGRDHADAGGARAVWCVCVCRPRGVL